MTKHSGNTQTATCDNAVLANRLFKYRFWDTKTNCLYPSMTLEEISKKMTVNNSLITLEFTGFTDKKQVEIYEGDICKYHKNTSKWLVSYHFEVRFKNGAFYAYWEREMMGKLEQHWDLLSQKDMRNIRVVSNIFQSTQTTS